jgi:hypothetical protein
MRKTVILRRTVIVPDPLARANVVEALAGAGGPVGVIACTAAADGAVTVTFETDTTTAQLIDALIEIEISFVPARARPFAPDGDPAAIAARGLADPDLDAARIIENHLP